MVLITISIPNDKVDDFKAGFLRAYPNKTGITNMAHIKKFIRDELITYYKTGKILIAQETTEPEIDMDVVEE